jgi:hypothetical protein
LKSQRQELLLLARFARQTDNIAHSAAACGRGLALPHHCHVFNPLQPMRCLTGDNGSQRGCMMPFSSSKLPDLQMVRLPKVQRSAGLAIGDRPQVANVLVRNVQTATESCWNLERLAGQDTCPLA